MPEPRAAANIFRMEYFGKKAFLTQSPVLQADDGGRFERVFEVAPVFRAEKHNTTRHLNEYISMDMEIGYIDSFADLMQAEAAFLQRMVHLLETVCRRPEAAGGGTCPGWMDPHRPL